LEKLSVAEHAVNTGDAISFDQTQKLHRTTTYIDRIVKETIEIQLCASNFNRENGYTLRRTWHPVINLHKHQPDKQAGLYEESTLPTSVNIPHSIQRPAGGKYRCCTVKLPTSSRMDQLV
jgi:hypothetical protein